ncbi:MAG TPA: tripartite tricarboxylate transporter substrate binding protein [Usitatibacter sp.]|nr:tripartite tricarboxylate transporter substrate binding protein [Usitatibacter sp.]
MKTPFLRLLALLVLAFASAAFADNYPARPIHFIVPYPAGGPLDTVARLLGQKVSESVHQPVVVENKPGAGDNIGADAVAKSAPDGYTILMGAVATHAINPTLYKNIPYDPVKDFAPVTEVAWTPNVLVVNPALPVSNVKEFVAYAKAHPGQLNFGSGSTGSAGHLAGELFKTMAGVQMVHVPYKGAGPAMQDLIGGQIQLMFDNLASSLGQIRAGKVRALAVTTEKRSSLAPELPTIAESGLPGFDISTWFGVFAPGGTPQPVVERLHDAFVDALQAPDVQATMKKMGAEPVGNTPAQFAAYIRSEAQKYAKVIKASGARVD